MSNSFQILKNKKDLERVTVGAQTACQLIAPASSGSAQSRLLSSLCSHIFSSSSDTDPCLALKFGNLFLKMMYKTVSLNMFFSFNLWERDRQKPNVQEKNKMTQPWVHSS